MPHRLEWEPARVLVDFATTMAQNPSPSGVLRLLGEYSQQVLQVEGVGVLLVDDGSLSVASANSTFGEGIEELEVGLGEGPCTDCVRHGQVVAVPDLRDAESDYPRFAPAALDAGVRSVHAIPLAAHTTTLGALDIFATDVRALSTDEVSFVTMLGDVAMAYLVTARLLHHADNVAGQLQTALSSRVVIEQAKGILVERHGITYDEAFERIRRFARPNGIRVREVAERIAHQGLDLSGQPSSGSHPPAG